MRGAWAGLAAAAVLVSGCGNTVYGPRRLIKVGEVDSASSDRTCSTMAPAQRDILPKKLADDFHDRACASLRADDAPAPARKMVDAGITLSRMRCNDFFAERAGNQTRERILRRAVAPVSALLTGIIGIVDFKTDAGRQEAIQILGIGEAATVAGLELYESEFLFGSSNINSVRVLTMRALDEHARQILDTGAGFYGAARHLIDHQMICTPANILELTQSAIREGRVAAAVPIQTSAQRGDDADRTLIATLSANLQTAGLDPDQLGSLWWLSQPGVASDQTRLTVIRSRLSALKLNPIDGAPGALTVDTQLLGRLSAKIAKLSPDVTDGFYVTARLLEQRVAAAVPADPLERTKDLRFTLPPGVAPPATGAVEVGVPPVTSTTG